MPEPKNLNKDKLFKRIKQLSNRKKFEILKLTQENKKSISELSKELNLAYNKCSNYVTDLEKQNLVIKEKEGKHVYVKSKITLSDDDLT